MGLPKKIKAGGITYTLSRNSSTQDYLDAKNRWGETDHEKQTVVFSTKTTEERLAETFLHEVLHIALFNSVAIETSELEERVVGELSPHLYAIFKANPQILHYFLGS